MVTDINAYRALTVYPDAIDDMFTDYVDPNYLETMAPPYDTTCPGYAVFHVVMNTVSSNANAKMQQVLHSIDGNQDVINKLNAGTHPSGTTICGIKSWVVNLKTAMPIQNIGTYTPAGNGDIAPGLFMAKEGQTTPATSMEAGDDTKISIFNFPKGSNINVQLVGGNTAAASQISTSLFQVYIL